MRFEAIYTSQRFVLGFRGKRGKEKKPKKGFIDKSVGPQKPVI